MDVTTLNMTTVDEGSDVSADARNTQPRVHTPRSQNILNKKKILSKKFAEYSPSQQLSIHKLRLWFLKSCRHLKRPPPSLRSRGATIIESPEMLHNLSVLESKNLEMAIKAKSLQISDLKKTLDTDPTSQ